MSPDRPAEDDEGLDYDVNEDIYPFPIERFLQELAAGVLQAQNAWMASIDSLRAPDRKTAFPAARRGDKQGVAGIDDAEDDSPGE
jgi:hypothetical protein